MTPQTLLPARTHRDTDGGGRGDTRRDEESAADRRSLLALRDGDESAFRQLARRHHQQMLRVARCYVGCPVAAEEVALDAWSAALRALDGLDERTSPRLWLFRILTAAAMARAGRDGPPAGRGGDTAVGTPPGMDAGGRWTSPPAPWGAPERRRLDELGEQGEIDRMITALPLDERLVVTLRDVCHWGADEVALLLAIPPAGQRRLLHDGRRRIHAALAARLRPAAA